MYATNKLLTTVAIGNKASRNIFIVVSRPKRKIYHMTALPWKHSLLRNLRKCAYTSVALYCTYPNSVESMANSLTHWEYNKAIMEPFIDTCYSANATSSTCEMTCNLSSNDLVTCAHNTDSIIRHLDVNLKAERSRSKKKCTMDLQKYKSMRKWTRIGREQSTIDVEDSFILRLLSFNILAQNLLEAYPYLYKEHNKNALPWSVRKPLLLQEILGTKANVICIQEMQEEHLTDFVKSFLQQGYSYLYKKRTNDKHDGLLLLYQADQFDLLDHAKVELYQSDIELLSRDNVGIIAKLALKSSPHTQIVVATTHLLFNPRRNDVRLAQTQLLLAEIERMAFVKNESGESSYLPIVLAGDFNLQPYSGVYKFITEGSFTYAGKGRNLESNDHRLLSNSLIPLRLCITDSCQHFDVLAKRLQGDNTGRVMLQNSEGVGDTNDQCRKSLGQYDIDINTTDSQNVKIAENHHVKFSSGCLTHPFHLQSVYEHVNRHGEREATTNQDEWITVDYIFFSDIQLLERYSLPTVNECDKFDTIPNFIIGSDHLCLGATFKLQKKK